MAVVGYVAWVVAMITSLPLWLYGLGEIALHLITDRKSFFRRVDRSAVRYQDPYPGLEHEMAEVNCIRLHIVVGGRAPGAQQKPLMLFVHGFPELWYSWRHQLKAFMTDYVVATYDLRGLGESEKPPDRRAYAMSQLVGDATGVIRHLGYEKCVLVGHDWGGVIAWTTTMWHPELVERLVTMGSAHPELTARNMDADQSRRSRYFWFWQAPWGIPELHISRDDFREVERSFRAPPKGVRNAGAISDEELDRYKQALGRPGCLHAGLNYYRAAIDGLTWAAPAQPPKAHKVTCPTLVLAGDSDWWLGPGLLRGIAEVVKRPEVHVLKGASHWIQQDKPEEVNQLMKEFLAK